jgi:hypothetical protein
MLAFRDKDIGRFDVAMSDACHMSRIKSIRDLDGEGQYLFNLQWTTCDTVFQCQSIKKFQGDKSDAVLFANVINRADVRVI